MSSCHHVIMSCHHVRAWETLASHWDEPRRACTLRAQYLAPTSVSGASSSCSLSNSGKTRIATKPVPITSAVTASELSIAWLLLLGTQPWNILEPFLPHLSTKHTDSWVIRLAWPFLIACARSESMPASCPDGQTIKHMQLANRRCAERSVRCRTIPATQKRSRLWETDFRSPVPGFPQTWKTRMVLHQYTAFWWHATIPKCRLTILEHDWQIIPGWWQFLFLRTPIEVWRSQMTFPSAQTAKSFPGPNIQHVPWQLGFRSLPLSELQLLQPVRNTSSEWVSDLLFSEPHWTWSVDIFFGFAWHRNEPTQSPPLPTGSQNERNCQNRPSLYRLRFLPPPHTAPGLVKASGTPGLKNLLESADHPSHERTNQNLNPLGGWWLLRLKLATIAVTIKLLETSHLGCPQTGNLDFVILSR